MGTTGACGLVSSLNDEEVSTFEKGMIDAMNSTPLTDNV